MAISGRLRCRIRPGPYRTSTQHRSDGSTATAWRGESEASGPERDGPLLAIAGQEPVAQIRRQRLDRLAHGDAGGPVYPRRQPLRDQLRAAAGRIAQDPADRLADEELLLVQHLVGVPGEPREVTFAAAQRPQQGRSE